jgi:alpha-beta hydrolase superfamily lysophospholipase
MELQSQAAEAHSGHSAGPSRYQGNLQPKGFPPLPDGFVSDSETFRGCAPELQLFGVHHRLAKPPAESKKRPHRVLVVSHGYGEHGGRYLHVPHYLKNAYDSFFFLDHRGHGRSEGLRGHVDRWDCYTDDLAIAIRRARELCASHPAGVEVDLLGHSMGGLIALRTAHLHPELPVRNLIVSAPLLGVAIPVSAIKTGAARLMTKLWPTLHMNNEIDPSFLSTDQEVGITYKLDRLVSSKGTPRWYTELLFAMEDTVKRDSGIRWPMLMLVPMVDKIVDEKVGLDYFKRLKHPDKQLRTYDGFYHEILNEKEKHRVFEDIIQWLQTRTASS